MFQNIKNSTILQMNIINKDTSKKTIYCRWFALDKIEVLLFARFIWFDLGVDGFEAFFSSSRICFHIAEYLGCRISLSQKINSVNIKFITNAAMIIN